MADKYASHNGSDNNVGSSLAPYRTIQKAIDNIGGGDTAYIFADEEWTFGAIASGSDLTISDGTTCTITAGSHTFTDDDIGKVIYNIALGEYGKIVSRSSDTVVTVDTAMTNGSGWNYDLADQRNSRLDVDNANGSLMDNYWQTLTGYNGRPTLKVLDTYTAYDYLVLLGEVDNNCITGLQIDGTAASGLAKLITDNRAGQWATRHSASVVDNILVGGDYGYYGNQPSLFVEVINNDIHAYACRGIILCFGGTAMANRVHDNVLNPYAIGISGGDYSGGRSSKGTISHNLIYNLNSDTNWTSGIYIDNGDWSILNNTVVDLTGSGSGARGVFLYGPTVNNKGLTARIVNNIFANTGPAPMTKGIARNAETGSVRQCDYNSFHNVTTLHENLAGGINDIVADPWFANPATGDFRITNPAALLAGAPDVADRSSLRGAVTPQLGGPIGPRQRYSGFNCGWRY